MAPAHESNEKPEPALKPINLTLEDIYDAASAISTADLCEDLRLAKTIERVRAAIDEVQPDDADHLFASSEQVIARASGVDLNGQFLKLPDADKVHRCRNVLAAIIALAADLADADPKPALGRVPSVVRPRPGGRRRALTDDEVLVLRVYATYLMRTARRVEPAITYLITEAGANPSEVTAVTPKRLIPTMAPNEVRLPGVQGLVPKRKVAIPAWGQVPLRTALTHHVASHPGANTTPIAYRGKKPAGGSVASACASGNLKRLFREVGIDHGSVTATSVVRWRVAATQRTHGVKAAARIRGLDAPKDALRERLRAYARVA